MKQQLDQLLKTEMDRKDFLKHVGIAIIAIVGIPALVRAITQSSQSRSGYSGGVYGGGAKHHG